MGNIFVMLGVRMNDIFHQLLDTIESITSKILQQMLNIIGFEGTQFALFDLFAVLVVSSVCYLIVHQMLYLLANLFFRNKDSHGQAYTKKSFSVISFVSSFGGCFYIWSKYF